MSKPRKPGSYGFRTNHEDNFLRRVAREAKPYDNFLVVAAKNTFTNDGRVAVLVRKTALPAARANLSLLGVPLRKNAFGAALPHDFRVVEVEAPNVKKAVNIAKSQIQTVKNFLVGRDLSVFVEAV